MTAEANTSLRWRFLTLSADRLVFKWSQAQVLFFFFNQKRFGLVLRYGGSWITLERHSLKDPTRAALLDLAKSNPYPPTPIGCVKKKKKISIIFLFFSFLFSFFIFFFSFLFNISFKEPRKSMWAACSLRIGVEKATKTESFMKTGIWTIQFWCWGQPHSLLEHSRSNLHWKF